jgi:DNA replication protein DnaC
MTTLQKKRTPTKKKTTPSASLRERVLEDAKTLKLPLSAETLDAALAHAEQEGLSHLYFLGRIFGEPAARSRQRAIERRIREAKFHEEKTLTDFDWKFNSQAIDRARDRAVGHRRVYPPPREPRHGRPERCRKKPSLASTLPTPL